MGNLIFDFDGTLFDTDVAHEKAYQKVFKDNNLGDFGSYEEIKGIRTLDIFENYTDKKTAFKLAKNKTETYLNSIHEIKSLIDLTLLEDCKSLGYRLFIVSGGSKQSIFSLLNLHNARSFFDGIVTSGDYSESKPSPESYNLCKEKYKIDGPVIGVEDSRAGIESLKRASIFAVGVHNEKIRLISDLYYSNINHFLKEYILHE